MSFSEMVLRRCPVICCSRAELFSRSAISEVATGITRVESEGSGKEKSVGEPLFPVAGDSVWATAGSEISAMQLIILGLELIELIDRGRRVKQVEQTVVIGDIGEVSKKTIDSIWVGRWVTRRLIRLR